MCKTGPTLKPHYANAIKLSNLAFNGLLWRPSLDRLPASQPESNDAINGYQTTDM